MIEVSGLTKTYGAKRAVDDISFTVQPGQVTGFLGPNGAGKSTTMRMILGLERPTSGTALVEGKPYRKLASPLTTVGSLLEAKAVHPRRTGANHLRAMAATHGLPKSRVDEVIDITGLSSAAKKKVGGYSLGMGQRLGIASAILGDPSVVILDEPVNGLDPEGVIWVRQMARFLASEGKTVFLSSHLMSEMAQTADHLIVIGQGRILADQPLEEFLNQAGDERVLVRTDEADAFAGVLQREGLRVDPHDGGLMVHGNGRQVAERAQAEGVLLYEISPQHASLEQVYMAMTQDSVEYRSADPAAGLAPHQPAPDTDAGQGAHAADAPVDAPASTGSVPAAPAAGDDADYTPAHSSQQTPWNQEEK
ncbi:ABC transporter ATP-binding protein [Rothia halotolerans]|uniref:ABC transporter ATP-binding protein n=1 Tax=Rothia halotolerans TaxID=405770 RepID=UPI00101C1737|nr:ABC transporter ATP-binding protein [Rothia halotolerans]